MVELRMGKSQVIHRYPSRVDEDPFEKQMRRITNATCETEVRDSPSQGYVKPRVYLILQLEQ